MVVNVWDRVSVERWIFTAAHELGHLLLHLTSYQVDESTEDKGQEVEANTFASHLLMPEETFRKEWAGLGVGGPRAQGEEHLPGQLRDGPVPGVDDSPHR